MSYFVYTCENLPNPDMMGKPGYTPDGDYIRWGGICLPWLKKGEWTALPESLTTIRRQSYRDAAQEIEIPMKRFRPIVESPSMGFAERGVIMLDHEPTAVEKAKLEAVSHDLNIKWRAKCVEFFENQRQAALARQGKYDPSPYVDECYDLLGFPKPYSVESLKSQRMPGHEAAERIATAMQEAQKETARTIAETVTELMSRPAPTKGVQAAK
jgi:hypothetical protein